MAEISFEAPSGAAVLERATALQSWQIGEVKVSKLVEFAMSAAIEDIFANATSEAFRAIPWLQADFRSPEGLALMSIHALIVETPTRRIMVDTCVGNDKERASPGMEHLQTPFLANLEAAGFARESFDVVLCTHLHFDHVGWNTMLVDGCWTPTFPKARYLINRTEYDYWERDEGVYTGNDWALVQRQTFADSIRPVIDAGLVDLVEGIHQVCDEVSLVPTIGHSAGHVSIRIRSGGKEALITGDMAHHPSQLAYLEWGMPIDHDAEQAIRTRQAMFADAAERDVLMIGTHWPGATAGRIIRDGTVFRLEI